MMEASPVAVEFTTPDDVILRGLRWGTGHDWLLLVHDSDGESDLDCWRPLVGALVGENQSVFAFDLRGHGLSEGDCPEDHLATDILAGVQYVRNQSASWVAVMATGQSAIEALRAADLIAVNALVLISPKITENDRLDDLRGNGESKLFAAGTRDLDLHKNVSLLRNRSIGWAMYVQLPTAAQGTDLLVGKYASQVRERIATFVAEQRAIARWSMTMANRQVDV